MSDDPQNFSGISHEEASAGASHESSSRFEDEFTEHDLAMVNLGYWDPQDHEEPESTEDSAEVLPEPEDTAAPNAAESKSGEADSVSVPGANPGGDENVEQSAETQSPAHGRLGAKTDGTASITADIDAEFSRVERIPGGVKSAIEAILTVADAPVSIRELSAALIVPERTIEHALDELDREYQGDNSEYGENAPAREPRGFELRQVAGGWRLYSRTDFAPWVARFVTRSQTATLSKTAYETLAIIAYRQPVTRAAIAAIRGTNADATVRQLVQRQLVRESGKEENTGATLYETTELFLTKLGLNSLEELPELAPLLPSETEAAVLTDT